MFSGFSGNFKEPIYLPVIVDSFLLRAVPYPLLLFALASSPSFQFSIMVVR